MIETYVLHHNDMDGYGAAAACKLFLVNKCGIRPDDICYKVLSHNVTKDKAIFEDLFKAIMETDVKRVFIVDYSINGNNFEWIEPIINTNISITIIDHHQSSIDFNRSTPITESNVYFRADKRFSGALLSYLYLMTEKDVDDYDKVPAVFKLIDDYDTFKGIYKESNDFKLYYDSLKPEDRIDTIVSLSLKGWCDELELMVEKGKAINEYNKSKDASLLKSFGYESCLEDGTPVYVFNRIGNSFQFGDKFYEYPAVIQYAFDGEKYKYSMYSYNEKYDCAKYAFEKGGGGHKGASGWSSDFMPFTKKGYMIKEDNKVIAVSPNNLALTSNEYKNIVQAVSDISKLTEE